MRPGSSAARTWQERARASVDSGDASGAPAGGATASAAKSAVRLRVALSAGSEDRVFGQPNRKERSGARLTAGLRLGGDRVRGGFGPRSLARGLVRLGLSRLSLRLAPLLAPAP